MAQSAIAQIDALLTQIQDTEVVPQFQRLALFFNRIQRDTSAEWVNGKGYKLNANMTPEASNAWVSEGGSNPSGGQPEYTNMYVNITRYRKVLDITTDLYQDLTKSGQGGESARINFGKYVGEMNANAIREMEEELMGDGTGKKATVGSGSSTTSIVLSTTAAATWGSSKGAEFLIKNGVYDLYDSSGSLREANITLSAVVKGTSPAATPASTLSVTPASTDVLVYAGSYNKAARGAAYFVNNDNGVFQMLSRSAYPELKSPVIDAASAALTVSTVTKLKRLVKQRALDERGGMGLTILTSYAQAEAYERLGYNLKRASMGDGTFNPAYDKIKHGDSEWLDTPVCDEDRMYFLDMKDFGRIEKRAYGFISDDGLKIRMKQGNAGTGSNAWFAVLGWDGNYCIKRPGNHGLIKRLATTDLATSAAAWG